MEDYAGDVTSQQAWEMLSKEKDAVLVDVRTKAEWIFVGVPDLGTIGKRAIFREWQQFPTMEQNPDFVVQLKEELALTDAPVLFLCRSGNRSRSAASALTRQGFTRCYNISDGFEGQADREKHRGRINGWKHADLPWVQG